MNPSIPARFGAPKTVLRRGARTALIALSLAALAAPACALADGPGVGTPTVVSVGDSYISGEGGRWAGNTNGSSNNTDALGSTAYYDNASNTGEVINRCHRSKAAEIIIGGGVNSKNLACSGAKVATDASGSDFKPGLDFYNGSAGQGQALMLQNFAASNNVKMVNLSIGGNDFNFASIVQTCVTDWLTSPSWWKDYCYDDSSVTANFTTANVNAKTTAIRNAILNINTAMTNAGYSSSQFSIVVQDYMSPIPTSSGFRYGETGYTRQNTGGCGFWNADANWAVNTALPTINNAVKNAASGTGLANVKVLDIAAAFNGHRLCESTVNRLQDTSYTYWSDSGAVNALEWFQGIRTATAAGTDYQVQESLHPDYWAQLGLRSCVRQAYNAGAPKGGTCKLNGSGLTSLGEPKMLLS